MEEIPGEEHDQPQEIAISLEERPIRPSIETLLDNPNNYCIKEFLDAIEAGDLELVKLS